MPDDAGSSPPDLPMPSIESRASWVAAGAALAILSVACGSTLLIVVGLRAMELDLGVQRATLALAGALTWVGTGLGGIVMGWLADRIGVRNSVLMGTAMIALGLTLSSTGDIWALCIGQGVLIGFLGMGAIYPPLLIHVSRWFDRRRGTAIALISSGQYIAGVMWPAVFERSIAGPGWRITYLGFAAVVLLCVAPLAALSLRPAPSADGAAAPERRHRSCRGLAGAGAPAERGAGDPLRRRLLLLRADGDPAIASGGVLRGHRHWRGDGSTDALRPAGMRVRLAAVLGRLC
jgi:MFS family permease